MTYRGYELGKILYDEDGYSGEVLETDDLVISRGNTLEELEINFHESIDSYEEEARHRWKRIPLRVRFGILRSLRQCLRGKTSPITPEYWEEARRIIQKRRKE